MSLVFDLGQGQRARLGSTDGRFVTLVSTQPFPPGATVRAELAGEAPYWVKVRGSRRVAPAEPSGESGGETRAETSGAVESDDGSGGETRAETSGAVESGAGASGETSGGVEFIVEGRWVNLSRRQRERLGIGGGGTGTL
ncbi:MAG: hypothetical protein JW940_16600 [Polyangiaceae bacterium]|nr:hypothetical protein [Polyangiaceae bacterium]